MSELTLRRAARLRSLIEARVDELRRALVPAIAINVFDPNPNDVIDQHAVEFEKTYARFTILVGALYELRSRIALENETGGVNRLLTVLAAHNAVLLTVRKIKSATPRLTPEQVTARIAGASSSAASTYNHDISFDTLPPTILEQFTNEERRLRLEIVEITDQLEHHNQVGRVTLTDALVSVLTAEGLI